MAGLRPDKDQLRSLFLFERLNEDQLDWLCEVGSIRDVDAGWVCAEGEPAQWLFVLLEGTVTLSSRVGGDDIEFARTDQPGAYGGAFQAYLGARLPLYTTTLRALTKTRFFVLSAEDFSWLMREWFPMAVHLLQGLFYGTLGTQHAIGQRERLLALGALAAGLSHELNNPASAIGRAASSLRGSLEQMHTSVGAVAGSDHAPEELAALFRLQGLAGAEAASRPAAGALESADREERLADWLQAHDVEAAWEIAPTLVESGLDEVGLERGWAPGPGASWGRVVTWLAQTIEAQSLAAEIEEASTRISSLVDATKQYTQLDRAPNRLVDVHDGLDSTLRILASRITADVSVVTDYDRELPQIPAFAGELNQVWTNLFENALDAMHGHGTLTIRTRSEEVSVLVEVEDTGPGIAEDLLPRVFEPFFTTKPVGGGTGLGLDIVWRIVTNRHHGDIRARSEPGRTTFEVRLPVRSVEISAES